jgi:hypothetical protein
MFLGLLGFGLTVLVVGLILLWPVPKQVVSCDPSQFQEIFLHPGEVLNITHPDGTTIRVTGRE